MVEDSLNLCPLGSVQNPDLKTLKSLTIWLDSTCAHSARHRSELSRKAGYSVGSVDDTSRAAFRKWMYNLRPLEPAFIQSHFKRLQLIIHLNLLAPFEDLVGVTEVDTDALPYLEEACYYLRKKGLSFQEVSKALEIPEPQASHLFEVYQSKISKGLA